MVVDLCFVARDVYERDEMNEMDERGRYEKSVQLSVAYVGCLRYPIPRCR